MTLLITGSSGLIGSELVTFFDSRAEAVLGVDNNMRADFFGPGGDTRWNLERLRATTRRFRHHDLDIRDRTGVERLFREAGPFQLIARWTLRSRYNGEIFPCCASICSAPAAAFPRGPTRSVGG